VIANPNGAAIMRDEQNLTNARRLMPHVSRRSSMVSRPRAEARKLRIRLPDDTVRSGGRQCSSAYSLFPFHTQDLCRLVWSSLASSRDFTQSPTHGSGRSRKLAVAEGVRGLAAAGMAELCPGTAGAVSVIGGGGPAFENRQIFSPRAQRAPRAAASRSQRNRAQRNWIGSVDAAGPTSGERLLGACRIRTASAAVNARLCSTRIRLTDSGAGECPKAPIVPAKVRPGAAQVTAIFAISVSALPALPAAGLAPGARQRDGCCGRRLN
jgi:hypothetical protein